MIRGRRKHWIAVAGASALVTMASLALVPLAASAQPVGTSTTVTAAPASPKTGGPVTLTAQVMPVTTDASTPTGMVTFSITGSDASVLNCKTTDTVTISHAGVAKCMILKHELLAAASPYTVDAVYSGDTNFTGSTGTLSLPVAKGNTKTKVKFIRPKPSSGNGETFVAKVTAGKNGSLLSGNVVFAVAATGGSALKRKCAGGDSQPLAVSGNAGTATCVLSAGWFIVPAKTKSNPHPHGSWNVTGTYTGNANLNSSTGEKSGHAK